MFIILYGEFTLSQESIKKVDYLKQDFSIIILSNYTYASDKGNSNKLILSKMKFEICMLVILRMNVQSNYEKRF